MNSSVSGISIDWQEVNAAHRQAECLGVIDPNMRKPGSVSIDEAFAQIQASAVLDELIATALHDGTDTFRLPTTRRSNGYSGISKTRHTEPYKPTNPEIEEGDLATRLRRLDDLKSAVLEEIEREKRGFYTHREIQDESGSHHEVSEIVDPNIIEQIKEQERQALTVVTAALRVDVLAGHRRTRYFPGRARLEKHGDEFQNAGSLRSQHGEYADNPVVQAMLNDLEKRLHDVKQPVSILNKWGGISTNNWEAQLPYATYFLY